MRWLVLALLILTAMAKECLQLHRTEDGYTITVGSHTFTSHTEPELLHRSDLDGDGKEELVYRLYSGGAHCCFELLFVEPASCDAHSLFLGNVEVVEFKDFNFDGIQEIRTFDDYSYIFGLCFACSPAIEVILRYTPKALRLDPVLLKATIPVPPYNKGPIKVRRDENGEWVFQDDQGALALLTTILAHLYRGETKEAKRLFTLFRFQNPSQRSRFAAQLVQILASGPFWPQIALANHLPEPNDSTSDLNLTTILLIDKEPPQD